MTDLVPAEEIERIVGVKRHATIHYGRAVSAEQKVYILHSLQCLDREFDLRECPYSVALDDGIDVDEWIEDLPCALGIEDGRLTPSTYGVDA